MSVSGKAIKTRIKSVKNTKKMTKAMEMVSGAKMRKAVAGALATRPYALLARELLQNLSGVDSTRAPLLQLRPTKKMLLVVVTSNRGLCGSFNSNVLKKGSEIKKNLFDLAAHTDRDGKTISAASDISLDVIGIGKKSALFAKRIQANLISVFDELEEKPDFDEVLPIAKVILRAYEDKTYDKVMVVFTHYRSPLVQEVRLRQLLPVSQHELDRMLRETKLLSHEVEIGQEVRQKDYIFEPNTATILAEVLPRLVEIQLYETILESSASEHSARMLAMKNATEAAGDLINALTLEYNKARQASITQEISEIVGGAAALE